MCLIEIYASTVSLPVKSYKYFLCNTMYYSYIKYSHTYVNKLVSLNKGVFSVVSVADPDIFTREWPSTV